MNEEAEMEMNYEMSEEYDMGILGDVFAQLE